MRPASSKCGIQPGKLQQAILRVCIDEKTSQTNAYHPFSRASVPTRSSPSAFAAAILIPPPSTWRPTSTINLPGAS